MSLKLRVLENEFTIHRFPPFHATPDQVAQSGFYSVSRTSEELSIVCDSAVCLDSEKSEPGWACIQVIGPLDFSLTGILAHIATVLAASRISLFAVSTFDTDYILVKSEKLPSARKALLAGGYEFQEQGP